jgi:pimeloyl-ACP methyl ester carboxylesterase
MYCDKKTRKMNKTLWHIASIFSSLLIAISSQAQNALIKNKNLSIQQHYKQAKIDFKNFEKKHGHVIETQNVLMHYLTWGDTADVPLIWSHGSFTNSYEMLPLADSLVKVGYYVIAIDYYGHGQTPIPNHGVSLYHVADDIKFLMDALKINKAIIGGWSRGGLIATAFYDSYSERILGLILEDGGSVSTNTHYHKMDSTRLLDRTREIFQDRMPQTIFESEFDAYAAIYDHTAQGSQFESLAWIKRNKEGKWEIGEGLLKLFNMSDPEEFLNTILRPTRVSLFAESMAIIEPKIIYRNLNVPMLILDPTMDNDLFPYELENEALRNSHPNLVVHKVYRNTGHNIHNERKNEFIEDVSAFLISLRK